MARRLGYVAESVGIAARHRRQTGSWAPHLERALVFVDGVATGGDHLLVLGSGRLLDLPLERVAPRYARVTLLDWVHPPSSRKRARRLGNVTCLEVDVTGCLDRLVRGRPPPAPARPTFMDGLTPPTTTVSLNLLSQLPVLPLSWMERWGLPETQRHAFARALLQAHVNLLASLPGQVALVTDVSRTYSRTRLDAAGEKTVAADDEDALHGLELGAPDQRWTWAVAPEGELEAGLALTLTVHAWSRFSLAPADTPRAPFPNSGRAPDSQLAPDSQRAPAAETE